MAIRTKKGGNAFKIASISEEEKIAGQYSLADINFSKADTGLSLLPSTAVERFQICATKLICSIKMNYTTPGLYFVSTPFMNSDYVVQHLNCQMYIRDNTLRFRLNSKTVLDIDCILNTRDVKRSSRLRVDLIDAFYSKKSSTFAEGALAFIDIVCASLTEEGCLFFVKGGNIAPVTQNYVSYNLTDDDPEFDCMSDLSYEDKLQDGQIGPMNIKNYFNSSKFLSLYESIKGLYL